MPCAVFNVLDAYQCFTEQQVQAKLQVKRHSKRVTKLYLSALQFTLPDTHTIAIPVQVNDLLTPPPTSIPCPAGGQLALVHGFLKPSLWPANAQGAMVTVSATVADVATPLELWFSCTGSLQVTGSGQSPLYVAGMVSMPTITLVYKRRGKCSSETSCQTSCQAMACNFALSEGASQTDHHFHGWAQIKQWYDTYFPDIYHGRIASAWADDSKGPQDRLNVYTRTGMAISPAAGLVASPIDLQCQVESYKSKKEFYLGALSMGINPKHHGGQNLVWTANAFENDLITSPNCNNPDALQVWRGASFDGGKTWPVVGRVDGQNGFPYGYSDSNSHFDPQFGNHWIGYGTWDPPAYNINTSPGTVAILNSADGGRTYSLLYTVPYLPNTAFYDYQQSAFGGDGQGGWAIYVVFDYLGTDGSQYPVLVYIPVLGLGSFGTPVMTALVSLAGNYTGCIDVSSSGDIAISFSAYDSAIAAAYNLPYSLALKRNGIQGLVDGSFQLTTPSAVAQVGILVQGSPGVGLTYSTLTDRIRGVPFDARVQWSKPSHTSCHRSGSSSPVLWMLVSTLLQPGMNNSSKNSSSDSSCNHSSNKSSQSMQLYLTATRNGQCWTTPYLVRDTVQGNAIRGNFKIDPITGDAYVTWYDGRDDPEGVSCKFYGALVKHKILDKLAKTLK